MKKRGCRTNAEECGAEPRKRAAERLLDVACELFYRRGIRAVGVDEIVCETGVTKPTLYRSFESKDDLVAICLRSKSAVRRGSLDDLARAFPEDPLGELRAIIRFHSDEICNPDYRGCELTNAAVEFPERDHPAREVAESCKAEWRARITALTRRLPVSDPEELADGLILMLEGACACRHTSGSQGPSAALVKSTEALISAYMSSADTRAQEPATG